jgi:cell division transport system permease protein
VTQEFRKKSWFSAPDIPFARDEANQFLPWIVAFMICLTGLMLATSLSLGAVMQRLSGDYLNSFTIQLPAATSAHLDSNDIIRSVLDNEWALEAREISHREMQALIEPWLGDAEGVENLPLPILIEVKIHEGANVDLAALERRLQQLAPGAEIDDYQQWMSRFGRFSSGVQYTVMILAVMIVLTTLAIVVLAAKTALRLHQQTVEVLYTIGAQDDYIAAQFQQNAMWLVFRGALFGTVAAALLFWSTQGLTSALESPLLPVFDFTIAHALLFAALPILTAMAALFSTRFAVLALLKRKP